jgi:hypothetical protein
MTAGLDQDEKRKRIIIYMVRFNRIDKWMADNIVNTGLSKQELKAEYEYCERTRKEIQSTAVGNAISPDGKASSWLTSYILWAVSEDNYKTHLHNLRVHVLNLQRQPVSESPEETRQRQHELQLVQGSYDSHLSRWLESLESEIGIQEKLLGNIPMSGDSNMIKIRDIKAMICYLKGE